MIIFSQHLADPGYADAWQASIACAAMDEGVDWKTANLAAQRFLFNLCEVTTRLPWERG